MNTATKSQKTAESKTGTGLAILPDPKLPASLEGWEDTSTEKAREAGMKFLQEAKSFRGTTNFAWVTRGGRLARKSLDAACHAGNENAHEASTGTLALVATENGAIRSAKSLKDVQPFLKWFITDSPWAMFIINRDDEEFCLNHGFLISADAPYNMVHSACIVTRHFRECYATSFKMFNRLTEKGVHPFIAYSLSFNTTISNSSSTGQVGTWGGHRASNCHSIGAFLNYFNGETVEDISTPARKRMSIYKSAKLYWPKGDNECVVFPLFRGVHRSLDQAVRKLRGEKNVEVYRPPNPFARSKPGEVAGFTPGEVEKALAPFVHNLIAEKLANAK